MYNLDSYSIFDLAKMRAETEQIKNAVEDGRKILANLPEENFYSYSDRSRILSLMRREGMYDFYMNLIDLAIVDKVSKMDQNDIDRYTKIVSERLNKMDEIFNEHNSKKDTMAPGAYVREARELIIEAEAFDLLEVLLRKGRTVSK